MISARILEHPLPLYDSKNFSLSYYFLSSYIIYVDSALVTLARFREIDADNGCAPREVFIIVHHSCFPLCSLRVPCYRAKSTLQFDKLNFP